MRQKRSFERAITLYDVIVVVVMPELFTNVCRMTMLLLSIPVLSQKKKNIL